MPTYDQFDCYDRGYGSRRYSPSSFRRGGDRHGEEASSGNFGDRARNQDRFRRGNGVGRRDSRDEGGAGAGFITGSGYEEVGDPISNLLEVEKWSGGLVLDMSVQTMPNFSKVWRFVVSPMLLREGGLLLNVNYGKVSIDSALREIFKYHVTVERTDDLESNSRYGASSGDQRDGAVSAVGENAGASEIPKQEQQDGTARAVSESAGASEIPTQEPRTIRHVRRSLVRDVINAALRKFGEEFADVRVVHDGMSALYSPVILPWSSKEFTDVDVGRVGVISSVTSSDGDSGTSRRRRPRTFVVKLNFVETISLSTLESFYSDPKVNVMPLLQALDVVVRHLAAQRLVAVGSEF